MGVQGRVTPLLESMLPLPELPRHLPLHHPPQSSQLLQGSQGSFLPTSQLLTISTKGLGWAGPGGQRLLLSLPSGKPERKESSGAHPHFGALKLASWDAEF